MEKEELSFKKAQSEARFFGVASVVLLAVVLLVSVPIIKAFAVLGLVVTGWQFLFQGSTAISLTLEENRRQRFQIVISLAVPAVFSLYFIKDTPTVTLQGVIDHMFSVWFFLSLVIIGYVSWFVADQLDKEHPFRGFLIACTVIFAICFMGYHGIHDEYNEYTESSVTYIDKDAAKAAAQTGRYFGQFLLYVAVSYGAMLLKFRKR